MDKVRRDLTAHCGGHPTQMQMMLIEQIAQQKLLVAKMDQKFAESDLPPTACDVTAYNQLSGALNRLLRRLAPPSTDQSAPSLRAYLAGKRVAA
jgi:hypothetical protein